MITQKQLDIFGNENPIPEKDLAIIHRQADRKKFKNMYGQILSPYAVFISSTVIESPKVPDFAQTRPHSETLKIAKTYITQYRLERTDNTTGLIAQGNGKYLYMVKDE